MTKPWFLNLILAVALAVAGARLLGSLGETPLSLPTPAEPVRGAPPVSPPPPPLPADSYEAIVEKNLFSPDRGKPEPAPAASVAVETPKALPPPKATLFGVVVDTEGRKFAFLTDDAKGGGEVPKRYAEGDPFSGGRIKEILSDKVVLSVGVSEYTVALRAPKQGIGPPARLPSGGGAPAPVPVPPAVRVPVQRTIRRPVQSQPADEEGIGPGPLPRRRVRTPVPARLRSGGYEEYPGGYEDYPYDEEGSFPYDGGQDEGVWEGEPDQPSQDDYRQYEDTREW